jgi:hypothetical protein
MNRFSKLSFFFASAFLISCDNSKAPATETGTTQSPQSEVERVYTIAEQAAPDTFKGSLKSAAKGTVGAANITITYHSPAVRGRIIWGGLVAFDKTWVAGAHKSTSIEFDAPLTFAGTMISPGKYALFMIPGKDTWTVILNTNWQQHLTDDYDPKLDVVRYTVTPQQYDINQERLMYIVENENISMRWERLLIPIL